MHKGVCWGVLWTVATVCSCRAAADISVVVDTGADLGPVKPMHAVNNGPILARSDQTRGNFAAYAAARIPFARTHDASFCGSYGGEHTVDVHAIFPDFRRDETDPANYDFACTDRYMETIRQAGTEVFFRLGSKIEHGVRKYGTVEPPDHAKWARICERIIAHYNEGWADGFRWNIRYWEIWNEPDSNADGDAPEVKRCWSGTEKSFFSFYRTVALHLKQRFPNLKVGGPSLAWNFPWAERFLAYMAREPRVPIDFFSWHYYGQRPSEMAEQAEHVRKMLDASGYGTAENILDEWNYIRGWSDEYVYSLKAISDIKGAAFSAAAMVTCQASPLDMLMYYDARPCSFNGLFDQCAFRELKGYYPFLAWSRLASVGRVAATHVEGAKDTYALAVSGNGRLSVLVVRYNEDDNVCAQRLIAVHTPTGERQAACHVTDSHRSMTLVPVVSSGGRTVVALEPQAFALLEF